LGPEHILDASIQLERLDEETLLDWGTFKIHTLPLLTPEGKPEIAVEQMRKAAAKAIEGGKYLLSLGGDHAASIGPIQAAANAYPDLGILQVDAHLDLREEWNGSRFNHACVMRRVSEIGDMNIVQVGIRAFSMSELEVLRAGDIFTTFYAHEIDPINPAWMEEATNALPETVYITIDLDGLDPSVIPGTGTPEPGGITYKQLVGLLKRVGSNRKVIAADIMELTKIEGFQVSEYTAAKIATKIMIHCFNGTTDSPATFQNEPK
jgi:agmatinase